MAAGSAGDVAIPAMGDPHEVLNNACYDGKDDGLDYFPPEPDGRTTGGPRSGAKRAPRSASAFIPMLNNRTA